MVKKELKVGMLVTTDVGLYIWLIREINPITVIAQAVAVNKNGRIELISFPPIGFSKNIARNFVPAHCNIGADGVRPMHGDPWPTYGWRDGDLTTVETPDYLSITRDIVGGK